MGRRALRRARAVKPIQEPNPLEAFEIPQTFDKGAEDFNAAD
jgi:hypothetical protein